jgi:integrase
MRGNITRRGKSSWRLKFDVPGAAGKRLTRYVTVAGKRADAEAELARLLNDAHKGTLVEPSKITVADYLRSLLQGKHDLTPRTIEAYTQIIEVRIIPTLGAIQLQRLKPADVKEWLSMLITSGARRGPGGLRPRSVRHCYRLLWGALKEAVRLELLARNVADVVKPPRLHDDEVVILKPHQITALREALKGSWLYPIMSLALASGCRRSELLALRWKDVGADNIKIERAIEETRTGGIRFNAPKSNHGRRTIPLPPSASADLAAHRKERAVSFHPEALVFCHPDGSPISPNAFSVTWNRLGVGVTFHALRHTFASALISAGIDLVKISRRLGHRSPVITLSVYAHLFGDDDGAGVEAIERMMR